MKKQLLKTLVALLAIAAAAAGPVRGQNSNVSWVLTPYGDLQTGDTVVIVDKTSERAMSNNNGNSAAPSAVEIELSGDQNALTEVPAATLKWVVVIDNGNYLFRKPGTDDYLYNYTTNNGVRVSTYSDDSKFTFANGGPNSVPFLKNTINNRYIGVYSNQDWRCYTSTSINIGNTVIAFYKKTVTSGGGSTPEPPTPGQNATTYNVTFGGFYNSYMNTTVSVPSLPQTFTEIGGYSFYPWQVISDEGGCEFTSVSVTSDGNGKVSANMVDWSEMTITVSGTFEGTATIHVEGYDPENGDVSRDITVACVAAPVPITVRMAAGTEEAANWSLASGGESVTGTAVLENVMSGSQVTATYNGTTKKVKSVKAVKYVAPVATVTAAPTATTGDIVAGSETALVNAGAASGGTMMYAVTTTNVQPASTADFSDAIPTAQGRTAGTYYVWFYAKADPNYSDSEIAGPVSVTVTSATITVTWNNDDITGNGYGTTFTKDGVTITAGMIDFSDKNFMQGGTFTTTLGNFTKIEVTSEGCEASGTGWSGNFSKKTWTGNASSVSFSGNIMGMGMGVNFVFTIE